MIKVVDAFDFSSIYVTIINQSFSIYLRIDFCLLETFMYQLWGKIDPTLK